MTEIRRVRKYLHASNDELESLWDLEAPQQDVAHYWLYEVSVDLDVDMDTGKAIIVAVNDVPLERPTPA